MRRMRVRVRLFAQQRVAVGTRETELDLPDGATVGDAWSALVARWPGLESGGPYLRFARNGTYAERGERLEDGDEVACIPPVAGGAEGADGGGPLAGGAKDVVRRIELTPDPIDDALVAELRRAVATPADGAVVVFLGQTRETPGTPAPGEEHEAARHAGQAVRGLEYEAFDAMARDVLDEIADEIAGRFGVRRLAIVHLTGRVALGEASVAIAVAAPHRGEAFDACRYAIEELKARAPIWKAEQFADGSVWIGQPARSQPT